MFPNDGVRRHSLRRYTRTAMWAGVLIVLVLPMLTTQLTKPAPREFRFVRLNEAG